MFDFIEFRSTVKTQFPVTENILRYIPDSDKTSEKDRLPEITDDPKVLVRIDSSDRENRPFHGTKNSSAETKSNNISFDTSEGANVSYRSAIGAGDGNVTEPGQVVDFEALHARSVLKSSEVQTTGSTTNPSSVNQMKQNADANSNTKSVSSRSTKTEKEDDRQGGRLNRTETDPPVEIPKKPFTSKGIHSYEVIDPSSFRRPPAWVASSSPHRSVSFSPALPKPGESSEDDHFLGEVIDPGKFRRPAIWSTQTTVSTQKQFPRRKTSDSPRKEGEQGVSPVENAPKTEKESSNIPNLSLSLTRSSISPEPKPKPYANPSSENISMSPTKETSDIKKSMESNRKHHTPVQEVPSVPSPRALPTTESFSGDQMEGSVEPKATLTQRSELDLLRAELASQVKWEAVRLQEAVRAQMVEDQKIAMKDAADVAQKHEEELLRVRDAVKDNTVMLMNERIRSIQDAHERNLNNEVLELLKVREEERRNEIIAEVTQEYEDFSTGRRDRMDKAEAEVKALSQRFHSIVGRTEQVKEASNRASRAFMLYEAIRDCAPLSSNFTTACGKSELGELIRKSVPEKVLRDGVRSKEDLKKDFEAIVTRGLSTAVVPGNKTGSIWAHVLGSIFSRLKVPVDMKADAETRLNTNEDLIRYARQLMQEDNLEETVCILKRVNGLAGEVLSDWVNAATSLIAAGLAADVLLADAIITQVSLTSSGEASA